MKKLKEMRFIKMKGKFSIDGEKWFDDFSELSELFFKEGKNIPMFKELIKFAKGVEARKFKPTADKLNVLKMLANALPNVPQYEFFKNFMNQLTPEIYRRDFRKFEGPNSVIAEIFSGIAQSVLYYEDDEEVTKDLEEEFGIDAIFIPAILKMLDEENFSVDDVKNVRADSDSVSLEVGREEWQFLTDEESDRMARQYVEDLIDDVGITSINGWEDFIQPDIFQDILQESNESYANDIASERDSKYDNRLVSECYDAGLIDDDDFIKDEDGEPDYSECLVDEYELADRLATDMTDRERDPIEWYRSNFGDEELSQTAINNNAVDIDAVVEYVIDTDGRGHVLSGYDGYEHDAPNNIYYYRTN